MFLLALFLAAAVRAGLEGTRDITVHTYIQTGSAQYVACGMPGNHLDLTRITAVNGLIKETQCGACLKVTSGLPGTKPQYVMAVDIVQVGLDLNEDVFFKLYGTNTGRFTGQWKLAHPKHCQGIVTGGSYNLPGRNLFPKKKKER
ncbi:hypothetical protein DSO57_1032299 [Entomophthora muscae]|uniref:Uncharacterized protein n=1 Tax=Entomophthora muscae TaxID=34485 RepID=A0ACC2RF66_9FUNG|nr:hypothetical protein DSO57_1032299 [Entomophthora muscae]